MQSEKQYRVELQMRNLQNQWSNTAQKYFTVRRDGQRERQFYVKDHLGSTRVVVTDAGLPLSSYSYKPFGDLLHSDVEQTDPPQKFTGHELEQEGDLDIYHAQARVYDPGIGRFMSVDPIVYSPNPASLFNLHGGKHLYYSPYAYTFNNPVYNSSRN